MNETIKQFTKSYLIKIKNISIILGIFFIISIFLGYALAHAYPDEMNKLVYQSLKDMIEPAKDYSSFRLFGFIFFKNLAVAISGILLGIIFGIIPVLIIIINGLTLGIVAYIILGQFSLSVFLSGILPHGIIEIPAIIFSTASGVWLWRSFYRYVRHDENIIKAELVSITKFFIFIIVPMLILAALIETFVTPYILNLIMIL